MIFFTLASGSAGNCTLVMSGRTKILVDCGISAKRVEEVCRSMNLNLRELDGVLVTHEHGDHIKGLKRLMNAYGVQIYGSDGTLSALAEASRDAYFDNEGTGHMHGLCPDRSFELGDMNITPFRTYHDTREPFGYRIEAHGRSACVLTDCGHYDDYVRDHLLGLDVLLLEANHDRAMLANGPYPLSLKRRIMSSSGHLSNDSAGKLLSEILCPSLKEVFLGHLSRDNNVPGLALRTVMEELRAAGLGREAAGMYIQTAPQDGPSRIAEV